MAMYGLFYGPWTCLHIALVITILVTPVTWTVILKEGKEETGSMGMDTPPPNKLDTALHIDQIIPDLLDRAPNYTAQIQWIGGARARLGNFISPSNITELPHLVAWHGNGSLTKDERNHYFTLLLTGPDHPSRDNPCQREFLYWHLVNIQGYTQEKRDTLVDYLGPNPASKTGEHRFVIFVFKQPSIIKFDEPKINTTDYEDTWRIHWNTKQFAKKYNLGEPYAINYFLAKHD